MNTTIKITLEFLLYIAIFAFIDWTTPLDYTGMIAGAGLFLAIKHEYKEHK
jgi:hypothetical protein